MLYQLGQGRVVQKSDSFDDFRKKGFRPKKLKDEALFRRGYEIVVILVGLQRARVSSLAETGLSLRQKTDHGICQAAVRGCEGGLWASVFTQALSDLPVT